MLGSVHDEDALQDAMLRAWRGPPGFDDRTGSARRSTAARARDDGLRDIVERYMDAMASGDVEAVVSLLAEDADYERFGLPASWTEPPAPTSARRFGRAPARVYAARCAGGSERLSRQLAPSLGGRLAFMRSAAARHSLST
jgi:hypothetical protein